MGNGKGEAIPLQHLDGLWRLQKVEAPRFQDSRHMMVLRLSALLTGQLYPSGNVPGTNFSQGLSRPQVHSAAGRIMSMKNSNETVWNRTRDLPTCSAVPQPTAPPGAPKCMVLKQISTVRCLYQAVHKIHTLPYVTLTLITSPFSLQ